ncbi:hypothetical protein D9756_009529 [Leucocoprinus leucothites]|uniref:Uncharacterized protein n=1 Tax=Leucocoprinus leucothites TaxID=201217 RepID=A0A8H5CWE7_9AGAR|nr:hypothetical protein D9756_009529 [Leucoagaricus leucothites]
MALEEILYYIHEDYSSPPRYLTRSDDQVELKSKGITPEEQLLQQWVVIEDRSHPSREVYEIHHSDVGKDPKALMKAFYVPRNGPSPDGQDIEPYSFQLRRVRDDEPRDSSYETRWFIAHAGGDKYNIFGFDKPSLQEVVIQNDSPMVASSAGVRHSWHFTPVNS